MQGHAFSRCTVAIALVTVLCGAAADVAAPPAPVLSDAAMTHLDRRLQEFSARFYAHPRHLPTQTKPKSFADVHQAIERDRAGGDSIAAVAKIVAYRNLIERNIDSAATVTIIDALLQADEYQLAQKFYAQLQDQGDHALASTAALAFVKYQFARNRWDETIRVAQTVGSDASPESFYRARLLHGIALQRLHKHRAALLQYAKIPAASRDYTAAKLNIALADIHQDWWTDAHITLDQLIRTGAARSEAELTDRLYTVIGYSLLNQGYFRNARDAFHNVGLDGDYTHRALLGLALCAGYQNDYVGALNAVTLLKDKSPRDLPVDEAYLLIPYFYKRLEQNTTALAAYSQAVKYYEDRIAAIEQLPIDRAQLSTQFAQAQSMTVIGGERLELDTKLPTAFFDNLHLLAMYRASVLQLDDAALRRDYDALETEYLDVLQKALQAARAEKIAFLQDYMSQARFGLATVHDNGVVAPQ